MNKAASNRALDIGVAIAASAGAIAVRQALEPYLGFRQPYIWTFAAVAVAAWYRGWPAGVVAAAICISWANLFFIDAPLSPLELVGTASSVIASGIIIFLADRARKGMLALKEADRHKNRFISVLAHELRNPLSAIASAGEMLARKPQDIPLILELGASLSRQAGHMERLVSELLDVERIVQGKIQLKKLEADLRECIRDAVEASRQQMADKQQLLESAIPHQPVVVVVDPTRITQIIANLLGNASRYGRKGGRIWLRLSIESHWALVSIRDDGPGIGREELEHVFELFRTGQAAGERGGIGIGLWLVSELARLHGGGVSANSAGRGAGAEFVVRLPLALAPAETLPVAADIHE